MNTILPYEPRPLINKEGFWTIIGPTNLPIIRDSWLSRRDAEAIATLLNRGYSELPHIPQARVKPCQCDASQHCPQCDPEAFTRSPSEDIRHISSPGQYSQRKGLTP